jgi:hypothetical protein
VLSLKTRHGRSNLELQSAKFKMREKDTMARGHTAILQFEISNLRFALAAAGGRVMLMT